MKFLLIIIALFVSISGLYASHYDQTWTQTVDAWNLPGCSFPQFCILPAGTYTITVTNNQQCTWVCIATDPRGPCYGWSDITYQQGVATPFTCLTSTVIYGYMSGVLPCTCTIHVVGDTLLSPLVLVSPTSLTFTSAQVFTGPTAVASGGSGNYTWSMSDNPSWISISADGVISGTAPTVSATTQYTATIWVFDGFSRTSKNIIITVTATPLRIESPTVLNYASGQTITTPTAVASGGTGLYYWTLEENPIWLQISSTGTFSGTAPKVTVATDYTTELWVNDNVTTASLLLTIHVAAGSPDFYISAPLSDLSSPAHTAFTFQCATVGGIAPISMGITGNPNWLYMDSQNKLQGMEPHTKTDVTFTFTITAEDNRENWANPLQINFTVIGDPNDTTDPTTPTTPSDSQFGMLSIQFLSLMKQIYSKLIPDLSSLSNTSGADFSISYSCDLSALHRGLVIPIAFDLGTSTNPAIVKLRDERTVIRYVWMFFLSMCFLFAVAKLLNKGG